MSKSAEVAAAPEAQMAAGTGPVTSDGRSLADILLRRCCPRCASGRSHRSHRRNWLERVLSLMALPYRCEFCSCRFYRFRGVSAER